jgi:hypothetical protein
MQMGHLINQLLVKSTVFQETFIKDKDHPTLQSLWKELDVAMKWAKIKSSPSSRNICDPEPPD